MCQGLDRVIRRQPGRACQQQQPAVCQLPDSEDFEIFINSYPAFGFYHTRF